jgi:translation initiation factor IF-2
MGGETQAVEVSATKGIGLDKLEEAILLQAEIWTSRPIPDRPAEGAVIEAKLDKGRGPVATVLVQRGTLKVGDIVVPARNGAGCAARQRTRRDGAIRGPVHAHRSAGPVGRARSRRRNGRCRK